MNKQNKDAPQEENALMAVVIATGFVSDEKRFEDLMALGSLRKTWVQVRKELKDLDLRDAIDWLDWASLIEQTLPSIRDEVIDGRYQPRPPSRYELGKGRGAFRFMTIPNLRDSLIYRHVSDSALEKAAPLAIKGAYFSRRHAANPVGKKVEPDLDPYDGFFQVWLRYNEYRTRTLLSAPYEILVVTDISNYFDSIEHDLLIEYLAPLGLPRKAVALLGKLIEVLKPTAGHSPNPRVGLPVDELDCSRQLAHIFLFEHDQNVLMALGAAAEDRYVRWMDDQNIGALSLTDARRIVNHLTRSLQKQRLTLNAGKTKFLTPDMVITEFHLDANEELSAWHDSWKKKGFAPKNTARSELHVIWRKAKRHAGKGHWDKLLKRFYAFAVPCGSNLFDRYALESLVEYPAIAPRIFSSLTQRGRVTTLIKVFEDYVAQGESLFEATEAQFFDSLLVGDLSRASEKKALNLVTRFLDGTLGPCSGGELGRGSAILTYYWLGGDENHLESVVGATGWSKVLTQVARAFLATHAATSPTRFKDAAIKFVGHPSDDVGRLTEFINAIIAGEIGKLPFAFAHLKPRWPLPGKRYDARAWLQLELLSRSSDKTAVAWLKGEVARFEKYAKTRQEKRVLSRIRKRIKP
jgi:hypothetical protein